MHKCVRCGNIYEDDDATILRGCTGCGGIFFLYMKGSEDVKQLDAVEEELKKKDTTLEQELIKQIEKKKAEEKVEEEKIEEKVERKEKVGEKTKKKKEKRVELEKIKFGIETVRVPKEGVYEINIEALMKKRPIVVFEKEKVYFIHLPQVFEKVRKR